MQKWVVVSWALLALVAAEECPDGGRCEEGQTCCNDPAEGYECCPFDQAECCSDHTHCCPAGTICDAAKSSCVNATVSIPWAERASAAQPRLSKSFRMIKAYMGEDDDNICPDQSRCPPEFSCLKALTKFGCCPLAQGVPCSDGKHCCPESHQCSADSRSCIRQELVTTVLCSDGVSECPDQTTCCENPEGNWGCCPIPKAVCCEDKLHCCPEESTCDVEHSKCISLSTKKEMPMWAKLPARIRAEWENKKEAEPVTAETVNDGVTEKAPEVTTANTVPPTEPEVTVSSVTKGAGGNVIPCNDTAGCLDETTCCKTKDGGWACCPLPEAVCCDDLVHCCPKGKKCNQAAQTCEDDTCSMPWVKKMPTIPKQGAQVGDVPCDSTTSCEDGTTCCKTEEGGWACCPLPEAVCCEDFIHCCPKGKTCNLAAQTCDGHASSMPWVEKVPAIPNQSVQSKDVPCDSTTSCEDGTTCCKTEEGGWACCPLPEAVCCEDFIHCCPKGKTCNLAAQTCDGDTSSMPWVEKVPAIPNQSVQSKDVPCDSTTSCEDGTTCCKTEEGGWACCPLPEAVCCEDFIHCCPKGKTCNLAAQTCDGDTSSMPWVEKVPAIPKQGVQSKDVPCDSTTSCEDGTTCCKTEEGGWACCPLPEAVCCEDFIHCCPKGKTCNLAAQTCDGDTSSMPWVEKVPAIPKQGVQSKDVPCDSTTSCEDGTTCCKTEEGGWACCPLPEAVCCEDFIHCCPKGKTCNLAAQTCDDDTSSMPWVDKVPAIPKQGVQVGNVACDPTASCPDGNTCCKNKAGLWACCPLPEAVCCDNHESCCPNGTTCDTTSSSCLSPSGSTPMKQKTPAFTTPAPTTVATTTESQVSTTMQTEEEEAEEEPEEVEATQAPKTEEENMGAIQCDAHTSCPQYTTCCFMVSSQKWGCCPLPEAVCCADGNHCCPTHYKCNEHQTSCVKGEVVIPWYTKLPATTNVQADPSAVKCDGLTQCPEHTTCCRLFTGEWGCCPLQNAVCCPDMEHCCPEGYTCNIASNSCQKVIMLQLETIPLTPVYLPEHRPQPRPLKHSNVKCDEQTSCKDGETCCKTFATTWGCCPSPNAVCCSDMMHCCPTGYTCTEAGACIQNTRLHWYNWHEFLANKKRALIV